MSYTLSVSWVDGHSGTGVDFHGSMEFEGGFLIVGATGKSPSTNVYFLKAKKNVL